MLLDCSLRRLPASSPLLAATDGHATMSKEPRSLITGTRVQLCGHHHGRRQFPCLRRGHLFRPRLPSDGNGSDLGWVD
jgi:hypothetical protein